jgi:hypothetical protein
MRYHMGVNPVALICVLSEDEVDHKLGGVNPAALICVLSQDGVNYKL